MGDWKQYTLSMDPVGKFGFYPAVRPFSVRPTLRAKHSMKLPESFVRALYVANGFRPRVLPVPRKMHYLFEQNMAGYFYPSFDPKAPPEKQKGRAQCEGFFGNALWVRQLDDHPKWGEVLTMSPQDEPMEHVDDPFLWHTMTDQRRVMGFHLNILVLPPPGLIKVPIVSDVTVYVEMKYLEPYHPLVLPFSGM